MIERIAFNLGRNDEAPNIDLAVELAQTKNVEGINEIVAGLESKQEQIANDCIKVLYEIGDRNPELIADYIQDFIFLLRSKNNRLVWGGMTALSKIVSIRPKEAFEHINIIIDAFKNGSVITRDNAISVFAELSKTGKEYEKAIFPLIIEHLKTCRPKEVGQHAERAFVCINAENAAEFAAALNARRDNLTVAQKKRTDSLLKRIGASK